MSKSSATKEKNTSGLDQNAIRRAAKARRKNTPKKNNTPGFSIREAKKERALNLREQREEARRVAIELRAKKQLGLAINECINAVFAGADRTGLCILYSTEKPQYLMNEDGTDYQYDDNGHKILLEPKYSNAVRYQARIEIIDWCEKNPGKYTCQHDGNELALANLMFVKKG